MILKEILRNNHFKEFKYLYIISLVLPILVGIANSYYLYYKFHQEINKIKQEFESTFVEPLKKELYILDILLSSNKDNPHLQRQNINLYFTNHYYIIHNKKYMISNLHIKKYLGEECLIISNGYNSLVIKISELKKLNKNLLPNGFRVIFTSGYNSIKNKGFQLIGNFTLLNNKGLILL